MALINRKAIPQEWANTNGWTRSYSSDTVYKYSKRPLIPANEANTAPTLTELLDGENPVNPIGYCGFLTSKDNPYVIIDIDAPKAVKEYIRSKRTEAQLSQDEINQMVYREVLEPCPQAIKSLLSETYAEYSASGCGVHIILKTNKSSPEASNLIKRAYWKAKDFDGQLSVHSNYMVTTGNRIQISKTEIKEVSPLVLAVLFSISQSSQSIDTRAIRDQNNIIASETLPSVAEVEHALMLIPLDQSARIKEVYRQVTGEQYKHYDFWLRIGMSLHDYATRTKQMTNGLAMYIKWSVQDKEAFVSDEDVSNKWSSFNSEPSLHTTDDEDNEDDKNIITYKTIFRISLAFQFNYPRRVHLKDGTPLVNPKITEYVNFKYLIDKYHLKLYNANGIDLYLTGDEDIIERYFLLQDVKKMFGYYGPFDYSHLQAATWKLCQDSLWERLTGTSNFTSAWIAEQKPEVDMFYKWLEQDNASLSPEYKYPRYSVERPREITPVPATFEFLESCIKWDEDQDVELCKKLLYKLFMQMIKLHNPNFQTFEDNGGMFALIGPENTYKTTFFKMLLPRPLEFLRHDVNQELNSEKNKRDFIRNLGSRAIILVDEFEGFMDQKKSGSFFKAIISGNTVSFTDIYQSRERPLVRKAVIVGTSNDARQIISDNGSRRLWFARIRSIDTSSLLNLDLHAFYQRMQIEFNRQVANGKNPWLISFQDTKKVTQQNKQIKALSSADISLREVFPYTTEYKISSIETQKQLIPSKTLTDLMPESTDTPSRFMKTQHVIRLLKFKGFEVPSTAELDRALERYCMGFIGQSDPKVKLYNGLVIERGRLCMHKRTDGFWNHKFWILPIEEDYNV